MFLGYKLTLYCAETDHTETLARFVHWYRNRESGNKMLNTPTHSKAKQNQKQQKQNKNMKCFPQNFFVSSVYVLSWKDLFKF